MVELCCNAPLRRIGITTISECLFGVFSYYLITLNLGSLVNFANINPFKILVSRSPL
jgi:hypothetical protein